MTTTVIRNVDWIVAYESGGHHYRKGDVAFEAGKLVHVGGPYVGAAAREIDGRGFMVMPGLVNIHSHPASEPLNKGWDGRDWLTQALQLVALRDHAVASPRF